MNYGLHPPEEAVPLFLGLTLQTLQPDEACMLVEEREMAEQRHRDYVKNYYIRKAQRVAKHANALARGYHCRGSEQSIFESWEEKLAKKEAKRNRPRGGWPDLGSNGVAPSEVVRCYVGSVEEENVYLLRENERLSCILVNYEDVRYLEMLELFR